MTKKPSTPYPGLQEHVYLLNATLRAYRAVLTATHHAIELCLAAPRWLGHLQQQKRISVPIAKQPNALKMLDSVAAQQAPAVKKVPRALVAAPVEPAPVEAPAAAVAELPAPVMDVLQDIAGHRPTQPAQGAQCSSV